MGIEYKYSLTEFGQGMPTEMGRMMTWKAMEECLSIGITGCVLTGLDVPTCQELAKSKFDMFIHIGDLHYSDIDIDDPKLFGDELTWCMAPGFSTVPHSSICGMTMTMVQTCCQWPGQQRSHPLRSNCHTQSQGQM